MRQHPNADLIRRGYEAFATQDTGALRDLFSDDVVWHVPAGSPVGGVHRGRNAVLDAFRRLTEWTGGTFRVEVRDIVAYAEHVVALTHLRSDVRGRQLDAMGAAVYHIRGGRIREIWSLWPESQPVNPFPAPATPRLQPSL